MRRFNRRSWPREIVEPLMSCVWGGRAPLFGTAPHSEPRVQPDPDLVLRRAGPGSAAVEGT